MLKVMFYGYGGSSWMAEKLRELIEDDLGMKLISIHEHPSADIQWNLNTVYKHLANADIIIVPANYRRQPCKSNNRLTQAMALGKAVICEPMPAYIPIVKDYQNAVILKNNELSSWKEALQRLRDDSKLREDLGRNALVTAKKYTLEEMSIQWINTLILLDRKESDIEELDVIIPTKNNIEILDVCLKSFKNSTLAETIYIIDNGDGVEDLVKTYKLPYRVIQQEN